MAAEEGQQPVGGLAPLHLAGHAEELFEENGRGAAAGGQGPVEELLRPLDELFRRIRRAEKAARGIGEMRRNVLRQRDRLQSRGTVRVADGGEARRRRRPGAVQQEIRELLRGRGIAWIVEDPRRPRERRQHQAVPA